MTTVRDAQGKVISEHVMTDSGQYIRRFKNGKPYRIEMINSSSGGGFDPAQEETLRLPLMPHSEIYRFELADDGETVTRRSHIRRFDATHCDLDKGKIVRETHVVHATESLQDQSPIYFKQTEYHPDGSQTIIREERSIENCNSYRSKPDKRVVEQIKANGDKTVTTEAFGYRQSVECFDKKGNRIGADIRREKLKDKVARDKFANDIKDARRKKSNLFQRLGFAKSGREKAKDLAVEYHDSRKGSKAGRTALFKDRE